MRPIPADARIPLPSVTLAILATLAITFVVPLPVYALLSSVGLAAIPDDGTTAQFMTSVLVMKIGTAIGFVLLFWFARGALAARWLLYAAIWWLMFAVVEVGQAIGPNYSAGDALGGIIAEAVYFPLSSWATARLLGSRSPTPA